MQTVEVISGRGPYRVVVGGGVRHGLADLCAEEGVPKPAAVVTNTTVGPLYGREIAGALGAGQPVELPDGEAYKRWAQVEGVCGRLLAGAVHRGGSLAAVGGGVVTDTAGFAAAVFLRGIAWVAVPTTLLGMVDAAVGGKTGINLDDGKNLVGAFWPPSLVVADVETLRTLPGRELRAGLAEVVKTAWLGDHGLLELLPTDGSQPAWEEIVVRSVRVKADVVSTDEREAGRRKALNLGHTLGHALETVTGYTRFLHGEAVAWGIALAARLASGAGMLSDDGCCRLTSALRAVDPLPPIADLDPDAILTCLASDKKRDEAGLAWVLPTDDGVALDSRVPPTTVLRALRELQAES